MNAEQANAIASQLTPAQRQALLDSVDFGTYRMVGYDNPEYDALRHANATCHGIVRLPVYNAILEAAK